MDTFKKNRIKKAINFIEELNWLLDSKKGIDLETIPNLLRELVNQDSRDDIQGFNKYGSSNQNKNLLIGVLPGILKNDELFESTTDLLAFAEEALKIKISKAGKRSRLEYIGQIVCEVINLNDYELSSLVNALYQITDNKEKLNLVKEEMKKSNFSWNETIQKLISNNV